MGSGERRWRGRCERRRSKEEGGRVELAAVATILEDEGRVVEGSPFSLSKLESEVLVRGWMREGEVWMSFGERGLGVERGKRGKEGEAFDSSG